MSDDGLVIKQGLKTQQRRVYIDTRTKQIEQGLQFTKEQGLGEWTVKIAGRSFVRTGD